MTRHDLVIRGGTIVDGTGRARYVGDVAVSNGVLTQVGGTVIGEGTKEIDASGLLVTPGFVDIHTHFDGQITWDEVLEPSVSHGVTTIVSGNCGVGFAPVAPERRQQLVHLMEGVEDIPGVALTEGMSWDWVTYPEYLDALDKRQWSVDVATQITHGALRVWVMGDRAVGDNVATEADARAMAALVSEALDAGALGFSTSRTYAHQAPDGTYVPGTHANNDELWAIAEAMHAFGRAVFEVSPLGVVSSDPEMLIKEFDWMRRMSIEFSLPVLMILNQIPSNLGLYREILDLALEARADGAQVIPQVSAKSQGLLIGLTTSHAFLRRPTFRRLREQSNGDLDVLVGMLRDPAVKAAILSEEDLPPSGELYEGISTFAQNGASIIFPMDDVIDQEPGPERSIAGLASAAGVSEMEMMYERMLDRDGRALMMAGINNYGNAGLAGVYDMITHPASVLGVSDAGAHCNLLVDACMPTMVLTHWVRDRTRGPRLSLESAVRMQTLETASVYGLGDRGSLEIGKRADLNVIDFEGLHLLHPELVHDLPAGGHRLIQRARGYRYTVVAGVITRKDDADTGARPGKLVRGMR
jgi:N-acyl-D-aspartate/D-glutamate deacylase